jgi:hypothetical protein
MGVRPIAAAALLVVGLAVSPARAAWIVEADHVAAAGKAHDHFDATPPGDGVGYGLSGTPSTAVGLIGNQSAFGNPANSTGPDLYILTYHVGLDPDNTVLAKGTVLGNSMATDGDGAGPLVPSYMIGDHSASGEVGNRSGIYNVYFTVPPSANVNAAGSTITVNNDGLPVVLNPVVMNNGVTGPDSNPDAPFTGGANSMWLKIATVHLTAGNTYTVTVQANATPPDFVSQRTHGVMWEFVRIPEPSTMLLAGLGLLGTLLARRRSN